MGRALSPFQPLAFAELPDEPRLPHPYFSARAREVDMPRSAVGPTRIHVREYGEGPPLLCVHGLMTSSYSFRYMLAPLGAHFRVIAVDLPGCGRSRLDVDGDLGPRALAQFLVELAGELGIRGCPVLGNSMGGYLMMRAALRDPDAFGRLLNLHSPGLPLWRIRALGLAMRTPLVPAFEWFVRRRPERFAHANVHYYDETLKSREEAREYGRPIGTRAGAHALARYLSETLDARSMSEFEEELTARRDAGRPFVIPLSLVYAARDPMVPPVVGRRLSALVPDAEMTWLDEASHFAHVDAASRFAAIALTFLRA